MDPFTQQMFGELRRRHPEVDIVVLPPDAPAPDPVDHLTDTEVAEQLAQVAAQAERIWALTAPGPEAAPVARLSHGPHPGTVVASARGGQHRPDGLGLLATLDDLLEESGAVVQSVDGRIPGLRATLPTASGTGSLTAVTSYAEQSGALVVTVSSDPLPVGVDRATALVRGAREGSR